MWTYFYTILGALLGIASILTLFTGEYDVAKKMVIAMATAMIFAYIENGREFGND